LLLLPTVQDPLAKKVDATTLETLDFVELFVFLVQYDVAVKKEVLVIGQLDLLGGREVSPDEDHHLLALKIFPGLFVHMLIIHHCGIN
jgi:hypothetical protein